MFSFLLPFMISIVKIIKKYKYTFYQTKYTNYFFFHEQYVNLLANIIFYVFYHSLHVVLSTFIIHFKNKCAQYWPDINDKLQGGTLTIRHLEEKTYAEYIIRRFKIHNKTVYTDLSEFISD